MHLKIYLTFSYNFQGFIAFLEAQLFYNQIDVTDSLTHKV